MLVNLNPKILHAGEGYPFNAGGEYGHVKLTAAESGGQMMFAEMYVEPGFGPPYHVHELEDELWYVLEGEVEFTVDGRKTIVGAGGTVYGPRGVPHRFQGAGDRTAKFVIFVTGQNFETFYGRWQKMMEAGPVDPEAAEALAREHGITFLPTE